MNLTERENEVMQLVCEGLTNVEIAKKLFVSTHTIKAHVESIFIKLHARNRARAVFLYCQQDPYRFSA